MRRLWALPLLLLLLACGGESASLPPAAGSASPANIRPRMQDLHSPPPMTIDPNRSYTATIHTKKGDIVIRLDPKAAPVTVNNFVFLAGGHYYDGLSFHRYEPGFVIQGGDPLGNGTGGPGYRLPNETNPAPWVKGSVGMASNAAGVNGSQFFILLGDAPSLAGSGVYNHFGNVTAGQDVAAAIRQGDVIDSITIAEQ